MSNLKSRPDLVAVSDPDPLEGYERYADADWDGYGADPLTKATLESARHFLRLLPDTLGSPDIAPGADGSIGLEWSFQNRPLRKLFIDIGPGNVWSGYWRRASGERRTLPQTAIGEDTRATLLEFFQELND